MSKPSQAGDSLPRIPRKVESHLVLVSAFCVRVFPERLFSTGITH